MKSSNIIGLILIAFAGFLGCDHQCQLKSQQVLDDLKGDNILVSYVIGCGATTSDRAEIYFLDDRVLRPRKTVIFSAYRTPRIMMEAVSPDTVKVLYAYGEVRKSLNSKRGVTFIYEPTWVPFIEQTDNEREQH